MKKNEAIYFGTGCDLLDMVIGGAPNVFGYPAGRFINIVGDKSAGKTFLACEIIAAAFHKYGKNFKWQYDDCESGFSFDTQEKYGFEMMKEGQKHSDTIEQAFCNIMDFAESLKENQFGIYVIDSLDGLGSKEADKMATARLKAHKAGKEFDEGSYRMGKPKYLSQEFFPQLGSVIQYKNILVIIISQVRENIDPYSFEKFKRNGGKALDHACTNILWLATMKKITKKSRSVGVVVKAKVTKSRVTRPFRECTFSLLFDYGLDNIGTNLDFLYELRTDKGELQPAAKALSWGGEAGAEKPNIVKIKKWLKSKTMAKGNKKMDALEFFKNESERVTLEAMLDFIEKYQGLQTAFEKDFGSSGVVMSREKLITYIEEKNQTKVLRQLVIDKWEAIEADCTSNRRKKYGTQPKGGE